MKYILITFAILVALVAYVETHEKDVHQQRMDLIEEHAKLVDLQNSIELQKTTLWADSLRQVIRAE